MNGIRSRRNSTLVATIAARQRMVSARRRATRAIFALRSPPSRQNRRNRAQQDLQIERRRPVVDVLQVELHPAIEVDVIAAADLPEARQSWLHRQPAPVPAVI